MTPEQIQQFADSLLSSADKLQNRLVDVAKKPVIYPRDIMNIMPVVGELHGTARALEWHAKHGSNE